MQLYKIISLLPESIFNVPTIAKKTQIGQWRLIYRMHGMVLLVASTLFTSYVSASPLLATRVRGFKKLGYPGVF
jgi:hypothetical protein